MKFISKFFVITILISIFGCEENPYIGTSIAQEDAKIVVDSFISVTGKSVMSERIQSRTITQLLGKIDANGYGYLSSDVVTQFMPAGKIDTSNVTENNIDSLKLYLQIPSGGYIGDSIAPMGLKVYRLNKQLPYPIYSDFNPSDYYSTDDLIGSTTYAANALELNDSVQKLQYRTIAVDLPTSLGKEFFNKYKENPAIYSDPAIFSQFFPGIYITNSFGSGRIMKIGNAQVKLYYHKTVKMEETGEDSTYYKVGNYFAVTPEIVTNNNITYNISNDLESMIQNGDNILIAPTGTNVEISFPTQDIIEKYVKNKGSLSVINSLTFEIPVAKIPNKYNITPPPYVLLIKKSDVDSFFANSQVTDNESSFYAAYNKEKNSYQFSDMRSYIVNMISKGDIEPEDFEFVIIPVSVNTENTTSTSAIYLKDIVPYIETPAMAKLLLDKAKIKFTYSTQTIKF
jgi:hypothetical protein